MSAKYKNNSKIADGIISIFFYQFIFSLFKKKKKELFVN